MLLALHYALAQGEDAGSFCESWAKSGECVRNPQYMYSSCADACKAQTYVDTDPLCHSWAGSGECDSNAEFMLHTCNASCLAKARDALKEQPHVHANPNAEAMNHLGLAGERRQLKDPHARMDERTGGSRISSFAPIFGGILFVLLAGVGLSYTFSSAIAERQTRFEEAAARRAVAFQRRFPTLAPCLFAVTANSVGRWFICAYFFNEGVTVLQTSPRLAFLFTSIFGSDGVWQEHVAFVDASDLAGAVAALFCALHFKPIAAAAVMLADVLIDAYLLLARILFGWLYGRGLYINELMAKKFSLLGCLAMLIAVSVESKKKKASFPGLLLEATQLSTGLSIALLIGRLLIAFLFLYVGLGELHRLLFQPYTPYLPGDGHDVVWPKAVELLLALPFTLGFRTTTVARLLATSLVLEAFYAWSWWAMRGDASAFAHHRRAIHYREHFMTNIATAGGLLLLQKLGGGKYTVDELMKKKD
jgi:alanyl-tRNA synthetase